MLNHHESLRVDSWSTKEQAALFDLKYKPTFHILKKFSLPFIIQEERLSVSIEEIIIYKLWKINLYLRTLFLCSLISVSLNMMTK